jgi:hypothetical protein
MSIMDKYMSFISEQVRKERVLGIQPVNEDLEKHLAKASTLEYTPRVGYNSKHEFTSPHDHQTIIKKYREHIKKTIPETGETHSRLTRPDTYTHKSGDTHETDFNSHNNNLETRGHNVVHYIKTERVKDGYRHTITQHENDDRH